MEVRGYDLDKEVRGVPMGGGYCTVHRSDLILNLTICRNLGWENVEGGKGVFILVFITSKEKSRFPFPFLPFPSLPASRS